ncbi:hypothetical protein K3172_07935 [Qipengyuania sp. 6B39]|uniref:hypothetical protein n=1 Tax=Qipengyuania proteolytica TaxID=2867239 RepID=UPI001C89D6F2|nr:hypothetical protein [Qipengyuania proteolytica]MBX7495785.1 hypothetical protein [Qipengyuania proteolytica]
MTHATQRIAASSLAIATLLAAQPALADGVPAGTIIENTASATYSDTGGTPQTVDSNTVTVQVDELLDVTVVTQDASAVSIGSGSAVLTFQVTNTGNGPEAYDLTADPAVAGNDFDVTIDAIAYDTNGNGVYDPGVDVILGPGEATPEILADGSLTVFVLVSAPAGVSDTETSQVNLLAEAVTGTGAPGTTFTGQGVDGSDAVVGTTGADDDDFGSLFATIASLSLVKSATVADPFGGNEAVPGATITFTIVASVTGSGSLADLRVTDATPTDTTYTAGSMTLDAASLTDAADTDAGTADASGIDVLIGDANAGDSFTITFDVVID